MFSAGGTAEKPGPEETVPICCVTFGFKHSAAPHFEQIAVLC